MSMKWTRMAKRYLAALMVCVLCAGMPVGAQAMDAVVSAQLSAATVLVESDFATNSGAIRVLIGQCVDMLPENDPIRTTLQSIVILLDTGTATSESVALLLRTAIDMGNAQSGSAPAPAEAPPAATAVPTTVPTAVPTAVPTEVPPVPAEVPQQTLPQVPQAQDTPLVNSPAADLGLPIYEVANYIKTTMQDTVLVDVPGDWGNNASGRALTSYSPVNGSGAISPSAGTLTLSYFSAEGQSDIAAFDAYTKNIAGMSVTTSLSYEDITAASLPARKIDFTMAVGANQFTCETVCFAWQDTVYAIELMQGKQTKFDYFPVYFEVVDSAEVGDAASIAEAVAQSSQQAAATEAPTQAPVQPVQPAATPVPTPEPQLPAGNTQQQVSLPGDIGSFIFSSNGHVYRFPTCVRDIADGDLPLNREIVVPYDFCSDADMIDGYWTEIVNTQYYYFENSLHKEMAGLTNMSGYPVQALDCVLTALIDTEGTYVDIVLPGDVRVGGLESDILRGFPEFAGRPMDGLAAFRGNELLYACNVRDDGCNGYVLIRNDDPYYSAVSIICENGIIKEISFECLGAVRAQGVFLEE